MYGYLVFIQVAGRFYGNHSWTFIESFWYYHSTLCGYDPIINLVPRVQVGPDDPHHGRLRSEPRDAAGEDHRRLLRAVRRLHPHAAHPHRGQQLRHLLQKQVKHDQTCKRYLAMFGMEIARL